MQWKWLILKRKKIKLLTNEQQESCENAKMCYSCEEKIKNKYLKDKKYRKVRDHCHYPGEHTGAAHSICNLRYGVPKKIPIVFDSWSNYDYNFIIKKLGEEFEKKFTCLGETTEKIHNQFQKKKKLQELIKTEKKLEKIYLTYYNLLIE